MFLHIGADVEVMKKDIVAIIDIDSINNSKISNDFITNAKKEGNVFSISEDIPKSIVLLNNNKKTELYLSPISSATLQKRIDFIKKLV